jgi:hypothetical protein
VIEGDGAAKIGQIPISMYNGRDQHIWKYSTTGEFTVRIAYHLANSCATYDRGEYCSYATRHTDTWKSIWILEDRGSQSCKSIHVDCGGPIIMYCRQKQICLRRKQCQIHYVIYVGWRRKQWNMYYGIAQQLQMRGVCVAGGFKNAVRCTVNLYPS